MKDKKDWRRRRKGREDGEGKKKLDQFDVRAVERRKKDRHTRRSEQTLKELWQNKKKVSRPPTFTPLLPLTTYIQRGSGEGKSFLSSDWLADCLFLALFFGVEGRSSIGASQKDLALREPKTQSYPSLLNQRACSTFQAEEVKRVPKPHFCVWA